MGLVQIPDPKDKLTNVEREMSVLGSFLIDGRHAFQKAPDLMPEHFSYDVLADLFHEVRNRIIDGEPHDALTIQRIFSDDIRFEPLGGAAMFVGKLVGMACPLVDLEEAAQEIIDLSNRRMLAEVMMQSMHELPHRNINEIANAVQGAFRGAYRARSRCQVSQAVDNALSASEAARSGQASEFITSGFPCIDEVINGYPINEITVIAGRPAMGKSAFGVSTALNVAKGGYPVLFFSLEMSAERLAHRMISSVIHEQERHHSLMWIPYQKLAAGRYSQKDVPRIEEAAKVVRSMPIEIVDAPQLTSADIEAEIIRWRSGIDGPGLVIVDYLGIMKPSRRYYGDMVGETTEKIGDLKAIAKRNDVAMVVLSQLNREVERRSDRRPQLSDLRDSGAIEQDAHTVMMLYREEYYLQKDAEAGGEKGSAARTKLEEVRGKLEVICQKNRNGPTATFIMNAHMPTNFITCTEVNNDAEVEVSDL